MKLTACILTVLGFGGNLYCLFMGYLTAVYQVWKLCKIKSKLYKVCKMECHMMRLYHVWQNQS
jgi:hypothetical protein